MMRGASRKEMTRSRREEKSYIGERGRSRGIGGD